MTTTTVSGFRLMSYSEWAKQNPDLVEPRKCPECDGTGELECECCGNFTDCAECGGTGIIDDGMNAYRRQLEQDKKRVELYLKLLR